MAGITIAELLVEVGVDSEDAKKAEERVKKLREEAERFGKDGSGALGRVGAAFKRFRGGVVRGAKLVGRALKGISKNYLNIRTAVVDLARVAAIPAQFVQDIANAGDEVAKTAARIGVTVEALQELTFAANIAGVDQATLAKGAQTFSKNLNDARSKGIGPLSDALKQLGVPMSEFRNITVDQAFERFGDIVADIEDPMIATAVASDAFGRAGKQLIPFFKQGSEGIRELRGEFKELGGGFTEDGAKASEEFVDAQLRLKTVIDSVKFSLADFLPDLVKIIDSFREWVQENREMIKQNIKQFILDMVAAGKTLIPIIASLAKSAAEFFGSLDEGEGKVLIITAAFVALGAVLGGLPGLFIALGGALGTFAANALVDLSGVRQETAAIRKEIAEVRGRQAIAKGGIDAEGAIVDLLQARDDPESLASIPQEKLDQVFESALKGARLTGVAGAQERIIGQFQDINAVRNAELSRQGLEKLRKDSARKAGINAAANRGAGIKGGRAGGKGKGKAPVSGVTVDQAIATLLTGDQDVLTQNLQGLARQTPSTKKITPTVAIDFFNFAITQNIRATNPREAGDESARAIREEFQTRTAQAGQQLATALVR